MDPFLESPVFFHGFHDRLIGHLCDYVQARLPEPYYADIGDRVWVERARHIEPDVNVLRSEEPSRHQGGNVAVSSATTTRPIVVTVPYEDHRDTVVEIYARRDEEVLVTSVEVLSLANKTSGEKGRESYLRKQQEILDSRTNLVEIDLLRSGLHTTAVPLDAFQKKIGKVEYHVCIHHFDNLEDYFIYPIPLTERLPSIAIPLLPGDSPVAIDLQAIFDHCYDTGPYRRRVRYRPNLIVPPLQPEQAEWVVQRLQAQGLLPASPLA
jgi:hypothetical protein